MRGGVPYRYLWRKHFPQLRASEVFISATVEPAPVDTLGAQYIAPTASIADSLSNTSLNYGVVDADAVYSVSTGNSYIFALKTNMLYDALATPNIGVEFSLGRHFSVGANWMYAWWQSHERNRHWRIYGGDINARYYFGEAVSNRRQSGDYNTPLQGHHIGVYGQVLVFQIAFGGKGYITGIPGENLWGKPYFGGGIEYGYSKRISKRLNIDFSLGLGYMAGEYRVYRPIDDHYVWQSSHRRNWIGPTKAEISLVWLIGKGVPK